jgi:hypothetical protein
MFVRKLWAKIKKWFRKHFGRKGKKPNPLRVFTVEIEE